MASDITRDLSVQGGRLMEDKEFLSFAARWQVRVRACRPYRPKTKAKVERPIRYPRESFVYACDFASDEDLNAQAPPQGEGGHFFDPMCHETAARVTQYGTGQVYGAGLPLLEACFSPRPGAPRQLSGGPTEWRDSR